MATMSCAPSAARSLTTSPPTRPAAPVTAMRMGGSAFVQDVTVLAGCVAGERHRCAGLGDRCDVCECCLHLRARGPAPDVDEDAVAELDQASVGQAGVLCPDRGDQILTAGEQLVAVGRVDAVTMNSDVCHRVSFVRTAPMGAYGVRVSYGVLHDRTAYWYGVR